MRRPNSGLQPNRSPARCLHIHSDMSVPRHENVGVSGGSVIALSPRSPVETTSNDTRPVGAAFDSAVHLPLVRRIASQIARGLPAHVPFDDLVAAGNLGLLHALRRFDPSRGKRFETFAEFRIRGAILDELRRYDFVARNARMKVKRVQSCVRQLTANLGRPPSEDEVADAMDMPCEQIDRIVARVKNMHPVSLDALGGVSQPFEPAANDSGPEEATTEAEAHQHLRDALAALPERQRRIVDMYYQREMTLKEIGQEIGVSESRVCQIMGEVTQKLRRMLDDGHSVAA